MNIRTANGVVTADKVGDLYTEQGVLTGYLVEESEYTLWPVEYEVQKHNAEYRQSKTGAKMVYPDDTEIHYRKVGNLWCLVTTSEGTDSEKGTTVKHPKVRTLRKKKHLTWQHM